MHFAPLIAKIVFSFLLSSVVLFRYGNWYRHRLVVTLVVLIAWFFSFLIIFALPLDVISTVFRQCLEEKIIGDNTTTTANSGINSSPTFVRDFVKCKEPWSHVPEHVFPNLWRTVYWSTQFLTWLIMPMMQSYIKSGDFTVKGKIRSALVDNAIYYGSYLLICGVLLIYLALKPGVDLDWSKLKAIASSASNTWGLFLLVLLLGYALVEVPRSLWTRSNPGYVLTRSYFKAAKLSSDRCEAEETVDDVLESLQAVSRIIKCGHPYHSKLETILSKIPVELRERMSRNSGISSSRHHQDSEINATTLDGSITEITLIRLHKQTIKSLQVLDRTETQWCNLIDRIIHLEDILKNQVSRQRTFQSSNNSGMWSKQQQYSKPNFWFSKMYTPRIQWYWLCFLRCYYFKAAAVAAAILSTAVVWSELTFFNKSPVLSLFAIIVNAAKFHYDYYTIEIFSTAVILYLSYCAYSTVLQIKLFNLYYLAPEHHTNEYSLIFSGMMLSRLTPPLCLNFLGLIHMDSHIIKQQILETQYTQIMGHMDVIAIIANGFNVYFPMMIFVLCLATYFSVGSRLLTLIGFQQFIGDDEMTVDLVEEGRELVKREKRRQQRLLQSVERRREFQKRFLTPGGERETDRSRPFRHTSSEPVRSIGLEELSGSGKGPPPSSSGNNNIRLPLDYDDVNLEDDIHLEGRFEASTRTPQNFFNGGDVEAGVSTTGDSRKTMRPRGIFDDI